ncbi:hypothetical protein T459_14898 [Capsicum annuum]|uniref:Uncharacterized protein n=1 Tax=Capsicum annuum TaxID=4072 RepID=A0A2G2ZIS8_CAPAN|nr:hypothetical protein T459_14898 [Capsicum annuum]
MSCEYAMDALQAKYGDGEGYGNSIYEYSSPIYKFKTYLLTYSEAINVVPLEFEWTVPQELQDTKIFPPFYYPNLEGRKSNALRAHRNDFDRLFHGLGEDRLYLERELHRIARFLQAILERRGMDGTDYITPTIPLN